MIRFRRTVAVLGALTLLAGVTACSEDAASSPTTVPALRVVSLSPTHTEILFALGAGDMVVAVDEMSNYPPETAEVRTSLSGYQPNVEAIAAYSPDLVVIGEDFAGLSPQLAAIDIEAWTSDAPTTIDEVYEQILDLGQRLSLVDAAEQLVAEMRQRIDDAVASSSVSVDATYYHELDDTLYTVTGKTFTGSLYALFGMRNITDIGDVEGDYPQLSAEFVLDADPDVIFLACTVYCGTTPESVAARPGWDGLTAVSTGRVIPLNDDVVQRWGPRIVEFVEQIAAALESLEVQAG